MYKNLINSIYYTKMLILKKILKVCGDVEVFFLLLQTIEYKLHV